jgi:TonB family protein
MLQGLIHKGMPDGAATRRGREIGRMPGIGFRLYANGEAQLIEVERSSGDVELDQAAVLAVVNAHPFPPFPPGTSDTHVDVHVEIPGIPR